MSSDAPKIIGIWLGVLVAAGAINAAVWVLTAPGQKLPIIPSIRKSDGYWVTRQQFVTVNLCAVIFAFTVPNTKRHYFGMHWASLGANVALAVIVLVALLAIGIFAVNAELMVRLFPARKPPEPLTLNDD